MFKRSIAFLPLSLPLILSGCVAPLAVGGIGAVGMSAVEDRGISGVASDKATEIRLNYALSEEVPTSDGIEITVYKGRVLLTGVVASEKVKTEIIRVARTVSGVKEIISGMNIRGEDSFSEYTRDGWMTTKLKATLYSDEDVIAPNYLVKTFDKIIYIFGTAQTKEEMQKVLDYAFDIKGVKKIVNLIEVRKTAP